MVDNNSSGSQQEATGSQQEVDTDRIELTPAELKQIIDGEIELSPKEVEALTPASKNKYNAAMFAIYKKKIQSCSLEKMLDVGNVSKNKPPVSTPLHVVDNNLAPVSTPLHVVDDNLAESNTHHAVRDDLSESNLHHAADENLSDHNVAEEDMNETQFVNVDVPCPSSLRRDRSASIQPRSEQTEGPTSEHPMMSDSEVRPPPTKRRRARDVSPLPQGQYEEMSRRATSLDRKIMTDPQAQDRQRWRRLYLNQGAPPKTICKRQNVLFSTEMIDYLKNFISKRCNNEYENGTLCGGKVELIQKGKLSHHNVYHKLECERCGVLVDDEFSKITGTRLPDPPNLCDVKQVYQSLINDVGHGALRDVTQAHNIICQSIDSMNNTSKSFLIKCAIGSTHFKNNEMSL